MTKPKPNIEHELEPLRNRLLAINAKIISLTRVTKKYYRCEKNQIIFQLDNAIEEQEKYLRDLRKLFKDFHEIN